MVISKAPQLERKRRGLGGGVAPVSAALVKEGEGAVLGSYVETMKSSWTYQWWLLLRRSLLQWRLLHLRFVLLLTKSIDGLLQLCLCCSLLLDLLLHSLSSLHGRTSSGHVLLHEPKVWPSDGETVGGNRGWMPTRLIGARNGDFGRGTDNRSGPFIGTQRDGGNRLFGARHCWNRPSALLPINRRLFCR
jgi:hypothetical protein